MAAAMDALDKLVKKFKAEEGARARNIKKPVNLSSQQSQQYEIQVVKNDALDAYVKKIQNEEAIARNLKRPVSASSWLAIQGSLPTSPRSGSPVVMQMHADKEEEQASRAESTIASESEEEQDERQFVKNATLPEFFEKAKKQGLIEVSKIGRDPEVFYKSSSISSSLNVSQGSTPKPI